MSVRYPFDTPAGSDVDVEGVRLLTQAPVARAFPTQRPAISPDDLAWEEGLSTRSVRALPVIW